jgi:tetratricopeptide (TPR) repeat protein
VGSGLSVAAGYPSTNGILAELARQTGKTFDPDADFTKEIEEFIRLRSEGELGEVLQKLFSPSGDGRHPTAVHSAIARLARAGCFSAVVTTNYDNLLERAFDDANVPFIPQPLEGNLPIAGEGQLRLLKLHGSREDWIRVILSSRSYQTFSQNYPLLTAQLDLYLRQRYVLFVGCSLQDPRILDWLAALSEDAARHLKSWRALITEKDWKTVTEAIWDGGHASGALARGDLRPIILPDHGSLPVFWSQLAAELAPDLKRLEIEIEVGAEGEPWKARLEGCQNWQPADPLADSGLLEQLETLRALDHKALPTDERGNLSPDAAVAAAALQSLAVKVGDQLTGALLSSEAREKLVKAIRKGTGSEPPLLLLQVRSAVPGEAANRRADRALALPWELLRLDERFPIEDGTLDLAREALVPDIPGLTPPDRPLAVVATVAAPVDATSLDYEGEMYRLWRALGREAEDKRLLVTDLGTLKDLAREVERFHPPVLHFTGHGRPGALLFEDEAALSDEVSVDELVRRLREAGPLPRLIYLSACHGATAGAAASAEPGERMVDFALTGKKEEETRPSTAASLHRAGFPQVVAYFGPVGDLQATRAAAVFYAAQASGKKAREALRRARRISAEPHQENGRSTHVYPFGWAQLAFYHRGEDALTALAAIAGDPAAGPEEEKRRIFERMDREGGSERVEGIRGVQRLRFGFVGRRKERAEALRRWRRGERQLVVLGLGGLGKTTLCAELAPLLARDLKPGGARALALDGRHAGAQPDPILALWQEFQAARSEEAWSQILADLQKEGLTGAALGKAALALAKLEGGLLLYLDDAESLQVPLGEGEIGRFRDPELRAFWNVLLAGTGAAGSLGLLASSRYLPEGTPSEAELHLPQLRPYEVVRLLAWMPTLGRLPVEDRAWLAEKIDGHPRTIEYLEVLARAREKQRVRPGGHYEGTKWREEILELVLPKTQERVDADLLLGKVWEALPEDAQEHLGRCTVITAPAPWEAVLALETTEGTTARLIETGMLSPFQSPLGSEDWWAPHRLVTEMARERWTGESREAHHHLGKWYEQKRRDSNLPVWAERAVQHLADAADGNSAWVAAELLVLRLYNKGRYWEALTWIERVLAADPTGPCRGKALIEQMKNRLRINLLPDDAEEILLRASTLVELKVQPYAFIQLGELALRQGLLKKSEEYSKTSAILAITNDSDFLGAAYHLLARVARSQGYLDTSKYNFELSLSLKTNKFDPSVAASLHELAGVLFLQRDLDGAKKCLEEALAIYSNFHNNDTHPDIAASLHALGSVLREKGDFEGAQRSLEKAIKIQTKVFDTDCHPDIAASLHELAVVLQFLGDLDGAQKTLSRALEISVSVFGTEFHPDVAATLNELATVLYDKQDLKGARKILERALKIKEVVYEKADHYSVATTEMNLGFLLLQTGETEAGAKLLAHAYPVLLKQLGPEHPLTRQLAELLGIQPS